MRRHQLSAAAAILIATAVLAPPSSAQSPKAIRWAPSLRSAMASAKAGNKLVMLDFYVDNCTWCKLLEKETYTDERVIQASQLVIPVKLNAGREGRSVAARYQAYVKGFPCILFLNSAGEVEGKVGGYLPPEAFAPEMRKYVDLHTEFPKAEAKYRAGDRSVKTIVKLIWGYTGRGDGDRAEALLEEAEQSTEGRVTTDLAKAYNAVADYHQLDGRFNKAIGYFRKVIGGEDPDETTYARISIAFCYMSQKKVEPAIRELRGVVAMPDATPSWKKQAEDLLRQLESAQRRQPKPGEPDNLR